MRALLFGFGFALALALPLTALAAPSENPQVALQASELSYKKQRYQDVEQAVRPLLYPTIELSTEESVVEAHRLLALSYFFQKKMPEARQEVVALLALRPGFELDPIVEPPVAVSFFQNIRREQEGRLQEIRRRQQEEAERTRRETERKRAAEKARAERVFIEKRVERHSRWLAMLPFGVGQLQNGQKGKAIFFAVSELATGALSLATWLNVYFRYPVGKDPATGALIPQYPAGEATTAQGLVGTQLASGAAFWALVAWGIIDAQVKYVPEVVKTRELERAPKASISIAPILSPGTYGLGISGAF
ncbi:MAG TPA: hypothetical protein VII38_17105 [Polyangia bacterium]